MEGLKRPQEDAEESTSIAELVKVIKLISEFRESADYHAEGGRAITTLRPLAAFI